jgi:hypothetical protein
LTHGSVKHQAKHFFYAAGWKKFERLWDAVIRARELRRMTPLLEGVLSKVTGNPVPSVAAEAQMAVTGATPAGWRHPDADERPEGGSRWIRLAAVEQPAGLGVRLDRVSAGSGIGRCRTS